MASQAGAALFFILRKNKIMKPICFHSRRIILPVFCLLCGFLLLASCSHDNRPSETMVNGIHVPALLSREKTGDFTAEYKTLQETYNKAVRALKEDIHNTKAFLNLATTFVVEGRITGNGSYYSNAAVKMLDRVLDEEDVSQDDRFEALSLKSTVLLNMHQFREALDVAGQGLAINPFNAGIYGALVDANVELGHYDEAVKYCDKMLSIRPDLRSYSRASYLRQIYGDNQGAIAAMKMAVDAGVPGAEQTEWARVNLGDLYLNIGQADSASLTYRTALVYRPEYPYAQMGMAKVYRAQQHYDTAISYAKAAIKNLGESSFVSFLADLYELKGDAAKAQQVRKDVIDLLVAAEQKQMKDAAIPHNGNRELALAYLNVKDYNKAWTYARKDYDLRPDNIDANELMGWIAYLKGDVAAAKRYADKTQVTHSRNANLLYKNALIYARAGESLRADTTQQLAIRISPYIDQRLLHTAM